MAPSGRTALYRIRGEADALLYVGVTVSVPLRWNHHMQMQPWWDELRSLTVDWYGTRVEALAAEEAAIKAELPKYNKTYLIPRKRRLRPVPEPVPVKPRPHARPMFSPTTLAAYIGESEDVLAEWRANDLGPRFYALPCRDGIRYDPHEVDGWIAVRDGAA